MALLQLQPPTTIVFSARTDKPAPADCEPSATKESRARQRRKTPKVRSGCLTCRKRRVKCDEGKPTCQNCLRIGRQCDRCPSRPVVFPLQLRELEASTSLLHAESSPRDKELFSHFFVDTVSLIAGNLDRSFWRVHLPQLSQVHPALWHGTIAIAALMTKKGLRRLTESDRQTRKELHLLAFKHYKASVRHLFTMTNDGQLSTADEQHVLTVVMVLATLCGYNGNTRASVLHVWEGFKLLLKWRQRTTENVLDSAEEITRVYGDVGVMYLDFARRYVSSWRQYLESYSVPALQPHLSLPSHIKQANKAQDTDALDSHPCPLIIRFWSMNSEVELHIHSWSPTLTWCRLVSMLRLYVNYAQALAFTWLMRNSCNNIVSLIVSLDDEPTQPIQLQGRHCCGRQNHHTATRFGIWQPEKASLWDSQMLEANIKHGSVIMQGGLSWRDPMALRGCLCVPGIQTCDDHMLSSSTDSILRAGGVKMVMEALGEVTEHRHLQVMELVW